MPKLTVAQLWLVHTLETLFFGAVVTGAISVYQAMGTGNYNASALAAIFIPAVIAVLSKGSASVINNANLVQAGEDTLKQLTASHQYLAAMVQQSLVQRPPVAQPQLAAAPPQPKPVAMAPVQPQVQAAPSDPFSDSGLMQAVNPPKQ
jgi:hypothetical protein